ncbi:PAAR domain-containing protein [Dyella sp. M7H15-1]|nr:PAAR domain-containing protein [Dyella sp. M7H15-1]
MQFIAWVGDNTTCGGKILTGSSTMSIDGRNVARVGDLVSCPAARGAANQAPAGISNNSAAPSAMRYQANHVKRCVRM